MWIRTWILTGILFSCLSVSAKEWLIDVRTAEEYLAEHVSGAMNIEYHRIVHEVANSTSKCNSRLKIRLLSEVRQKPPVAV